MFQSTMKQPLIMEIKGNSLDDGPGIRSVVFFKGCPLSCLWCHNPEGIKTGVEIAFDADACVRCNQCSSACEAGALSMDNPVFIDRNKCSLCMDCTEVCPSGALSQVGKKRSVQSIVDTILKDKPFFDHSGGGVTLSGGEPTLYMEFVKHLLKSLKQNGFHTLLETCGHFNAAEFETQLYPYLDMIYFDIKLINEKEHIKYCGRSNVLILDNFKKLYQRYLEGGITILPRTPLIPGITDTDHNIRSVVTFLKGCKVTRSELLEYHPLWQNKKQKLGIATSQNHNDALENFGTPQKMAACRSVYLNAGIEV